MSIKNEFWWVQEVRDQQNHWPYVVPLKEIYLVSETTAIDFNTPIHKKSPGQVRSDIDKLIANGLALQDLNARASNLDPNCPEFPVNGSASRVNKLFEELILEGTQDLFVSGETQLTDLLETRLNESIDERLARLDKATILAQAKAFDNTGAESHYIANGPKKVRKESQLQKRRVAALEDYTCQVCGFRCEYVKTNGKKAWIIQVDHILEKCDEGPEKLDNLWVLCPNCHCKKTYGIIKIDLQLDGPEYRRSFLYGQLIWNDFWATTQDYNLEPQDPDLFLKNARDSILRFRNHPSIAVWCGRNEGVPQPIINEGLANLIHELDGTRYYSPSSNRVNLRDSGPYKYQDPSTYYKINRGFSVELGVPSMPTLESFRRWIPKEDQWPISDAWAYHDWHQAGNGDVAPFMQELETQFGAATDLEDFERKAQMLNYVEHRAIFEGFNSHLWAPNSGRLLWMTQPAWPSSSWQILSSDYDTQASFYGVKKACEPVHVQLDLVSYEVDVVNTTTAAVQDASLGARVYSLENKLLLEDSQKVQAGANMLTPGFKLELAPLLSTGMVFVRLTLNDATGKAISDNFYWLGGGEAAAEPLATRFRVHNSQFDA